MEKNNFEILPRNSSFICLFSGGKDCGLALSIAKDTGVLHSLLHYCFFDNDTNEIPTYDNNNEKEPNIEMMASVIDTSVSYNIGHWKSWTSLVKTYKKYKDLWAEYVVFGDLHLIGNYELQSKLCISAGLKPFFSF